jgi:two-component system nitrogen regulation sensor histidine kinase GlnL
VGRDPSQILDALPDGVLVFDAAGRVETLNLEACRILQGSVEGLEGEAVESLLGAEHALARLVRTTLATGSSAAESGQRVERRIERDLLVDLAVSPLLDPIGVADGAVAILRDLTLRHSLEARAAERDRLDAFGRIAAGLAHEIKNPLSGIQGAAELIALRSHDDKTRETADLVVREARRIATLVDDFGVFSEREELRLAPTNLHQLLDRVLDLLAVDPVGRGTRVERLYDPSLPELRADPDRLTQVFLNLARNALQALSGSGTLSITTRWLLEPRLSNAAGVRVPTVAVELHDTGPGIPPELLQPVRTPFFSTRPGGTGLGLAVAEYWTARHGGTLELASAPGEGTRVRVSLPVRREA